MAISDNKNAAQIKIKNLMELSREELIYMSKIAE